MLAIALVPQLHGCLWESIHVDGTLDASSGAKEEQSGKPDDSLKSEEDTNEESIL